MTITFQLQSSIAPVSKPAAVTLKQLCAFRAFAQAHGYLIGVFDDPNFVYLEDGFEARVCPWSWATLAAIFGNEEAVICVIEEAQFLGLNVRFWKQKCTREIMIGVSSIPDGSFPMNLSDTSAQLLLDAIGMGNAPKGTIFANDLAHAINDPPTRRHLAWSGMETFLEQLDRMIRTCLSTEPQLVWQ